MNTTYGNKKNYRRYTFAITFIFFYLLLTGTVNACPYCNSEFYNSLLKDRNSTLAGRELLRSIMNQSDIAGTIPLSYFDEKNFENIKKVENPPVTATQVQQQTSNVGSSSGTSDFIDIIDRDNSLPIPPTGFVPQDVQSFDKELILELSEGEAYIGRGVMFKGFVTNGSIPGPTLICEEGDVIKFTVVNKGKLSHGASIHAAYTQTSKYLGKIEAGKTKSMYFKVTQPGVFLYHCAPGGHAIPLHIIFGQYGMMVVNPKKQYKMEQILKKKPDVSIYLLQHELYSNGKDAIDGKPIYVTFNGKLFRYVEEPIKAKPGDYVRIYFINAGPNLISTFHIVGILWDYVYWQGNPDAPLPGGQTVTSGPSDSWVIEFRMPPDEGSYLMLTHAVGSTDRGAIGILACDRNAQTPVTVMSDGPVYSPKEMDEMKSKVTRIISPFEPGTPDVDPPSITGPETKEVTVKIIGNSFYPKVINISPGTTVKWINEDVFSYMDGEFSGIHNVATFEAPKSFASPLLAHTETYSQVFDTEGTYKYMCGPHPYMRGEIIVGGNETTTPASSNKWIVIISIVSFLLILSILMILLSVRKRYELLAGKRQPVPQTN